jgi:hypothetical protein
MVEFLEILAGLLLIREALRQSPTMSRIVAALDPFDVVIGVILLVVGILSILSLKGILLILAGLVLSARVLSYVPAVGPALTQAGNYLTQFRVIIGIIVLVVGLIEVVSYFTRPLLQG